MTHGAPVPRPAADPGPVSYVTTAPDGASDLASDGLEATPPRPTAMPSRAIGTPAAEGQTGPPAHQTAARPARMAPPPGTWRSRSAGLAAPTDTGRTDTQRSGVNAPPEMLPEVDDAAHRAAPANVVLRLDGV